MTATQVVALNDLRGVFRNREIPPSCPEQKGVGNGGEAVRLLLEDATNTQAGKGMFQQYGAPVIAAAAVAFINEEVKLPAGDYTLKVSTSIEEVVRNIKANCGGISGVFSLYCCRAPSPAV